MFEKLYSRRSLLKKVASSVVGTVSTSALLSGCLGTGVPTELVTDPNGDDSSAGGPFVPASLEMSGVPSEESLALYCICQDGLTHGHQVAWSSGSFAGNSSYSAFTGLGMDQLGSVEKLKDLAAQGQNVSVLVAGPNLSTHVHQVVLTPLQLSELAEGKYVRQRTSNAIGSGHEHSVVLALPRAATIV